jgi:hypothetical protein
MSLSSARLLISVLPRLVCAGLSIAGLAACQPVLTTSTFDKNPAGSAEPYACRNSAGAYALPRHILHAVVKLTDADANGPARYNLTLEDTEAKADGDGVYCLDFLFSAWAEDKISISRSGLLLQAVKTSFDDRTIDIANSVVDAAAAVAAASAGARSGFDGAKGAPLKIADFEFDPFDKDEIHKVNKALKELDHCIFIDPVNDPYVPDWQADLCNGYLEGAGNNFPYYGLDIIDEKAPPQSLAGKGILYRPLLTHKLVVMKRNHDPVGKAWQVFETKRVEMSNAAPAFLLEVKRSALVARTMDITFNKGVLNTIEISKPSEAKALSGFVLRTAQVIVSIPVRALVIGKTEAQNRQALIKAQADLIATLRAYDAAVEAEKAKQQASAVASLPAAAQTARAAVLPRTEQSADIAYQTCVRDSVLSASLDPEGYCANLLAGADRSQ